MVRAGSRSERRYVDRKGTILTKASVRAKKVPKVGIPAANPASLPTGYTVMTDENGVVYSRGGSGNWREVGSWDDGAGFFSQALWYSDLHLYGAGGGTPLFRSPDGGTARGQFGVSPSPDSHTERQLARSDDTGTFLAREIGYIKRSTDNGATWTFGANNELFVRDIRWKNGLFFASTHAHPIISDDDGATWETGAIAGMAAPRSLSLLDSGRFVCTGRTLNSNLGKGCAAYSDDNGATWSSVIALDDGGIASTNVHTCWTDGVNMLASMYESTANNSVAYWSTDGGETWTEVLNKNGYLDTACYSQGFWWLADRVTPYYIYVSRNPTDEFFRFPMSDIAAIPDRIIDIINVPTI